MLNGILGKKLGMTQIFREDGELVPATVLQAGPCVVVQRKSAAADGYEAAQLAIGGRTSSAPRQQRNPGSFQEIQRGSDTLCP